MDQSFASAEPFLDLADIKRAICCSQIGHASQELADLLPFFLNVMSALTDQHQKTAQQATKSGSADPSQAIKSRLRFNPGANHNA
jgi:hypothetical protein